ncbi:5-formyltetrahydrofolate cyclo-ligase [Weissella sagaensis]|uniref:5-formyltetrahydrofolate cyclo-ligase n=1 Tax=Weissella sagaensis TaxID=2559928 RepID=UPI00214B13E4|nr:5-formyltetrahydrofolate cyclo-ligase [Weissella sagaensis]
MVTKQNVRQQALANLAVFSDEQYAYFMQQIVSKVTALPAWQSAQVVALTISQAKELPTDLLIQTALLQRKVVVLPRVLPNKQMVFMTITQNTRYERHKFGMLEPVDGRVVTPSEIDFVLVPGIAFTQNGHRVGFGGGYYDQWLPQVTATKIAVSITANVFSQPIWPLETTDQMVDQVIVIDEEIDNE